MAETVTHVLLTEIIAAGKFQGLDQKKIVARAGVGASTLSKAKANADLRVSTLARLANAVGLRVSLAPNDPTLTSLLNRQLFNE
ncbi:MAG: helix-turn-helix domain-containing protein [Gammaproteobacteria bacterium]